MRKRCDLEEVEVEKNGENSGPLLLLPANPFNAGPTGTMATHQTWQQFSPLKKHCMPQLLLILLPSSTPTSTSTTT